LGSGQGHDSNLHGCHRGQLQALGQIGAPADATSKGRICLNSEKSIIKTSIIPAEANTSGSFKMEKLLCEQITIRMTISETEFSKFWPKFLSGPI